MLVQFHGELIIGLENGNKTWKQNPKKWRSADENIYLKICLSDAIRIRGSSFTNISSSGIIGEVAGRMNGVSLPTSQTSTPSLQLCDHLLSDKVPAERGKYWQMFQTF